MTNGGRAALALAFQGLLWLLGTPGLDYLPKLHLDRQEVREQLRADLGQAAGLALAIDRVDRRVREPIVDLLEPLQRPFRISQDWSLYRDGPSRYMLLEIYLDGELRFRTADPRHAWLAPQLRNRHVRPVVESTAMKKGSPNWRGLASYVIQQALAQGRVQQQVELRSRAGPFPGRKLETTHTILASAPGWEPVEKAVDR